MDIRQFISALAESKGSNEDLNGFIEVIWDGAPFMAGARHLHGRLSQRRLLGELADCILRGRSQAAGTNQGVFVGLSADSISDRMATAAADYIAKVAAGVALGLFDRRGRSDVYDTHGHLHANFAPDATSSRRAQASPRPLTSKLRTPFTGHGELLIKALLANRLPAGALGISAPDFTRFQGGDSFRGVAELARVLPFAPPTLSQILTILEQNGWLDKGDGYPRLVRIPALLKAWSAAAQTGWIEVPVRFLLPEDSPREQLLRILTEAKKSELAERSEHGRVSLAGFEACRHHGVNVVRGAPLQFYVEHLTGSSLEMLGMCSAELGSRPDAIAWAPRVPVSIFHGRVDRDGLPVCDALQCWLDLADHPARGREQADAILRKLGLDTSE